ncbi:hypothetical protein K435DRAFT_282627 [Dendrothele bispora CBS 962.96]|uniref:Uncharacterized protein n=1 Tax=Dendrothele bispora (strain CBS 962.96) TaxID=1314807 RepID=A0A4S8LKQ3_DENBC|nr:hypothetical protein K435DRAFT_282586 [Dendrothele bispora CBS 962.96]THU89789.1 hypothetical protein K435DRAFT_282627 [Dendrothele bispora CBS 962.96]
MLQRREEAIHVRDRAKRALFPLRRVPAEIILEVTEYARDDEQATDANGILWVMGKVCGSWREIILGTPSLWTNVFVDLSSSASDYKKDLVVLRAWLDRSKDLPLNVRVRTTKRSPRAPSNQMVNEFLRVFVEHCKRWQSAHFNLGLVPEHWLALSQIKGQLPMLQRLHLDGYLGPHDTFQIAPMLQSVSLGHFQHLSSFDLPSEITHFTVDSFSLQCAGLQYLSRYSRLIELAVNDSSSFKTPSIVARPDGNDQLLVTFPQLQKLHFTFKEWGRRDIKEVLATKLVLPTSLEHVEVSKLSYFGDLVARHQCSFSSLTINHPYYISPNIPVPSVKEVLTVLRPLSLLTTLSLHRLHDLGDYLVLIEELIIRNYESPPSFLPHLKHLTFSIGDDEDSWHFSTNFHDLEFHSSEVFDMLRSRWNVPAELIGPHRLESFVYTMNLHEEKVPALGSAEMTQFDVLRRQGMRVEFNFVEFEGKPTSEDDDGSYEIKRWRSDVWSPF